MLARFHRAPCVVALAALGLIACAPATSSSISESRYRGTVLPLTPTARVIDSERIRRSGSQSALDAIRALVPGHRTIETGPMGVSGFGFGFGSRSAIRVLVDGHPIADLESLRMIAARDLVAIHVLSAPDATIRLGANYAGGAIILQTRSALRPLEFD